MDVTLQDSNYVPGTNLPEELLKNNKTDIFIETGTAEGAAVLLALKVGFKEIYSAEKHEHIFVGAKERLKNYPQVRLFNEGSEKALESIFNTIDKNKQITFWLDAHTPECPLYQELESINLLPRKDHIILIDDIRCFGVYGVNLEEVKSKVLKINPGYQISFADSLFAKNDILVAKVN